MRCAWQPLVDILPPKIRYEVDQIGRESLQELRLRLHEPAQLVLSNGIRNLSQIMNEDDLQFPINAASRYSPWAAATVSKGYLTAPGGHRIGLCGEAVCKDDGIATIKNVRSLCIRVARDFPGIGKDAPKAGSVLILGPPGRGKTTLLRDLIRQRSNAGVQVSVVDERGELFPERAFDQGRCTDILYGCGKAEGILMLLRTMGPQCIAADEITQAEDCSALLEAAGCGVDLLATAHASDIHDLKRRRVYRAILEAELFQNVLVLQPDKRWRLERMSP